MIAQNFSLYLDAIQDPGNMGTILRIADWFSIPYVFCSPDCVEVWSPKVVQASMGACLRVDTFTIDFFDLKKQTPSVSVMVTALEGHNIFKETMPRNGIVVIGNEGNGVRPAIAESADFLIHIPGGGGSESLNAAVATGIVCAQLIHGK
ncbi:MAG: RNA methyltransferase [Saprospiraceae bacterium]|nr:RNA methyltransferase [Saprospiraceae bacterium]